MNDEPQGGLRPDDEDDADIDRLFDGSLGGDSSPDRWELLAAALSVQMAKQDERELPVDLRRRILAAAPVAPEAAKPASGKSWMAAAGWLVAAALLVAWLAPWTTTTKSFAERRAELLAESSSALKLDWAKSDHPDAKTAAGDVVWDAAKQEGYMRFRGLRPNDPTKEQYQLWVFDADRDERYPVDGGVFDVPAGQSEVIVPIRTPLKVAKPALFAVTREKPGGVVVSDRSQLVILAKP
jgi:hypothetical protein